jgi:hypothetical protein
MARATGAPVGPSVRVSSRTGAGAVGLLSRRAPPAPRRSPAPRLECTGTAPRAPAPAPRAAAGRGGTGHDGGPCPLPRPPAQGEPHASCVLPHAPAPQGVGAAHGPPAADGEWGHRTGRTPRGPWALERPAALLVSRPCRGHPPVAVVRQSGSVEPVAPSGYFTPCCAGRLIGKMGTRPAAGQR